MDRMREQREWNRYLEFIDSVIADEREAAKKAKAEAKAETKSETRIPEELPLRPEMAKHVGRLSLEDQDAWSDRMKTRYGGEW